MNSHAEITTPGQLRQRESTLALMVEQIDAKLIRLRDARASRVAALTRIRSELALTILNGGSDGPDQHGLH